MWSRVLVRVGSGTRGYIAEEVGSRCRVLSEGKGVEVSGKARNVEMFQVWQQPSKGSWRPTTFRKVGHKAAGGLDEACKKNRSACQDDQDNPCAHKALTCAEKMKRKKGHQKRKVCKGTRQTHFVGCLREEPCGQEVDCSKKEDKCCVEPPDLGKPCEELQLYNSSGFCKVETNKAKAVDCFPKKDCNEDK